jgi:hypothetical protein
MSQVKTKVVAFRVSEQDFNTLAELANRLFQMGQVKSQNPNLLAKEYTFAFANIVMKMQGWTETTQQDQTIFALARGMADTMGTNPCEQQQSG